MLLEIQPPSEICLATILELLTPEIGLHFPRIILFTQRWGIFIVLDDCNLGRQIAWEQLCLATAHN